MVKKIIILSLSVATIFMFYSLSAKTTNQQENIRKEPVSFGGNNYAPEKNVKNILLELKKPPFIN